MTNKKDWHISDTKMHQYWNVDKLTAAEIARKIPCLTPAAVSKRVLRMRKHGIYMENRPRGWGQKGKKKGSYKLKRKTIKVKCLMCSSMFESYDKKLNRRCFECTKRMLEYNVFALSPQYSMV